MNNMSSPDADNNSAVPKHLESLATTVFRSLFPPINPQATPLKSIRRVVLVNREQEEDGTFILNFRHYAITTKLAGVSKQLRRINAAEKLVTTKNSRQGKMPNLGKLQDISDYMIGGDTGDGYMTDATSGSEADTDAEVEVVDNAPRKVMSTKARLAAELNNAAQEETTEDNVERRAVKLVELGPRMRLRLTKVEEGMCGGKIMWHEYVKKSQAEIKELEKRWEQRRKEKEARKKEQKANVERKKAEKESRRGNRKAGEDDDEDDTDMEDYSDYEDYNQTAANRKADDDAEWEDEDEEDDE